MNNKKNLHGDEQPKNTNNHRVQNDTKHCHFQWRLLKEKFFIPVFFLRVENISLEAGILKLFSYEIRPKIYFHFVHHFSWNELNCWCRDFHFGKLVTSFSKPFNLQFEFHFQNTGVGSSFRIDHPVNTWWKEKKSWCYSPVWQFK